MAIPNFQFNVNYPTIRDKTMLDTMWETVAPYENMKEHQLDRQVKQQKMELDLLESARNEERLGMDRERLVLDQKRGEREETRFGQETAEWERKKGLREAIQGAALKGGNDPMQALLNVRNVVMAAGEPSLALEFQDAAMKYAGSLPDYNQQTQALKILGIQATPEQLAMKDAKVSVTPEGYGIYNPLTGYSGGLSEYGKEKLNASREARGQAQSDRNNAKKLRFADAAFSDIEKRAWAVERYRERAQMVRTRGANMWSAVLAEMTQNRENTSGAPADPAAAAQWLEDRANLMEKEIPAMIQQAGKDFGEVADEAITFHPTLNNYRQHLRPSSLTPSPAPAAWAPSPGSIGNEVRGPSGVTSGATVELKPGSTGSKAAKLRKAGVVTTVKQAQDEVKLTEEAKKRQAAAKEKMGRW